MSDHFALESAPSTVSGTVSDFMVDGEAMSWSVELQSAGIDTNGAIAAAGNSTAGTVWSITGREGAAPGTPTWSGQLHDPDESQVPGVATGRFESVFGDIGHMIGAFGTTRQP